MGYDASVYLIYGIRIQYTDTEDILSILRLIVPDLIEEYGEDDVFSCFDENPHENGYYCINLDNSKSELFISCFFHEHISARGAHDCLEVNLPSNDIISKFNDWCKDSGIEGTARFYTKLYESY